MGLASIPTGAAALWWQKRQMRAVDREIDQSLREVLLEEHEKREDPEVAKLKDAIQTGIVSGPGVPAQEVFDRLEKKYATTGNRGRGEGGRY